MKRLERKSDRVVEAGRAMKVSPIVDHVKLNRGQEKKKWEFEPSAAEPLLHYGEGMISGKQRYSRLE